MADNKSNYSLNARDIIIGFQMSYDLQLKNFLVTAVTHLSSLKVIYARKFGVKFA